MNNNINPYEPPQTEPSRTESSESSWLWLIFIFGVPLLTVIVFTLLFA